MKATYQKDGYTFKTKKMGKGIPLVVIGSVDFYEKGWGDDFLDQFEIHLIDFRGYAQSAKIFSPQDFTIEHFVDDALDLMEKSAFSQTPFLIGHSSHSYIALALAAKKPELAKGLILVGAGSNTGRAYGEMMERWNQLDDLERKTSDHYYHQAFLEGKEASFLHYCKAFHSRSWHNFKIEHNFIWDNVWLNDRALDYTYRNVFPQLDLNLFIQKIHSPVLCLTGKSDYLVAPRQSWTLDFNIPMTWSFVELEKSGHYPFWETPDAFQREIYHWIKKEE